MEFTLEDTLLEYSDILTVYDLMEILSIGKSVAYRLLRSGEIEHFRIGDMYRIPKRAVVDYLNNCCE